MSDLAELVRIRDPQFYLDDPYPVFARMRREAPAFFCEDLDTFVVTRYDDVRRISRSSEGWSVGEGILLNDVIYGGIAQSFFPEGIEILSLTDPPRHHELRRVMSPAFTPRRIAALDESVRRQVGEMLDALEPGDELEFVDEVAAVLPLWVVAQLLGLPGDNISEFRRWTDDFVKMGSAATVEELARAAAEIQPMAAYLFDAVAEKRRRPDDGLISLLVGAQAGDDKLDDMNIVMLSMEVLTAGNITTRNLLTGLMLELARNPAERKELVADPSLAAGAVEEALRYVSPVTGFIRTARIDTEIAGTPVKPGEHAYLLYMAANRDESVFPDPDRFDISRPADPAQLAFGFGPHICIGAPLARLEGKIFLEELIGRFPHWDVTGPPQRTASLLHNGWASLPLTFAR
jgi:cytochrome P450